MTPKEILENVRALIQEHSKGDADRWWYANRFVFARLQLDERKIKTGVKKSLLEPAPKCHLCGKPFETQKGIHLHRLDDSKGYSQQNCVLMHAECHQQHHVEAFERDEADQEALSSKEPILVKKSKFYGDMPFLYWWDVIPPLEKLDRYREVRFLCKDTGLWCSVDVQQLKSFLAKERQTSRGSGHWGIKVLAGREEELAFEPGSGKQGGKWLYLPVTWEDSE